MAQAKRRRKHRGTQAGTVERPAPSSSGRSRGSSRAPVRQQAAERRAHRLDTPPTWRGSINRAVFMAVVFAALVAFVLDRGVVGGLLLGGFMLLIYIPMSYYTDLFIYRRRQRGKAGQAKGAR